MMTTLRLIALLLLLCCGQVAHAQFTTSNSGTGSWTQTGNFTVNGAATVNSLSVTGSPIPIASGGTGATTATGATSNLQFQQAGTGAIALSVTQKFQQHVSVIDYGALCNGSHDDTAGFNAAATAVSALYQGGVIDAPPSTTGCLLTGTVTLPANVTLAGQGQGTHLLQGVSNINPLIALTGNNAQIRDLDINAAYSGTNTSGTTILYGNYTNLATRNVTIEGPCVGIDENGNTTFIDTVAIRNVVGNTCRGIRVGLNTTQGNTVDPRITNTTVASLTTNRALADLEVIDAGGLYLENTDFLYATHGTLIDPGTNNVVLWPFFSNAVLGDTTGTDSLAIAPVSASSGIVEGMMCQGCWISSSQAGVGMNIGNGSGNVTGVHFVASRIYGNYANGAVLNSGSDITFDASAFCNNNVANNGSGSIAATSGVSDFSVRNSKVGGTCDSNNPTAGDYYGINLNGSNANAIITGNDFTGLSGGAVVGSTPTGNSVIANNAGFDQTMQTVASASSITLNAMPTAYITGNTAISTINGGWNGRTVRLWDAGGAAFTKGGNICEAYRPSSSSAVVLAWYSQSGSCWLLK